jgi:Flp pilus assembly protein CpaB
MLLAGALGVLLTLTVLRSADQTRPVLVAAHDLAPGTVVGDGSVRVARVHADPGVLATMFAAEQLDTVRGQVVTTGMRSGELLTRSAVRAVDAHAATRVMSIPVARAHAVDGKLTAGDRVDVVAVDREQKKAAYVVSDAEVVGVDGHDGGALATTSDDVTVSLVVDGTSAPRLAAAVEVGTVTLVRSTGAPPLADVAP